ncbi:hypothetical protein HKBW3C_01609, partial [Candidatus Hakubella thermalkaliphila]
MVESISYLNLRERLLLRSEGFAGLPSTEKLCLVSSISGGGGGGGGRPSTWL